MKLSELFELSPLAWEEAMREVLKSDGLEFWIECVREDYHIMLCIHLDEVKMKKMWHNLFYHNDTTLLKQWEAKQIELQQNK